MTDHPPPSIAQLYRAAQASCSVLLRSLTAADLARPVPALPGWTVRDTVSHLVGVTDDAINGRMEGAPGEAWTAAQLARWHDAGVVDLLDQWDAQAAAFADAIEAIGESRPPIDCHAHEQDIRAALGRPGNRDHAVIDVASAAMIAGVRAGRPLVVELQDGTVRRGGARDTGVDAAPCEPLVLRGVTAFEIFRSRLGRRSRAQVEAYDWSDDPADVLAGWFVFGPAATAVIE